MRRAAGHGLSVVLAGRGRVDTPDLLRAFASVGGQATVLRRCADLAELLACAPTSPADVAVVASSLRRLDRDAVATLQRHGLRVVVVCDHLADLGPWQQCGADAVVMGDDPAVVVASVIAVGPAVSVVPRDGEDVPEASPRLDPVSAAVEPVPADLPRGRVVAVWGPTGAPGRTTVALGLADELARGGRATLLVDADTYGAAVGIHLGLLDDTSGLAATTRLAALGRLDADALHRAAVRVARTGGADGRSEVGDGLTVLTGLARPSRWPELREASLRAVLDLAATCYDCVVVDVGFGLGAAVTAGAGLGPPDRDDATRTVLAGCDTLVAVGAGDAVGLVRLARELGAACDLAPGARRLVVVNRARRSALGPRPQRQAADVLTAVIGTSPLVMLPDDPAACDLALLQGRTLAECAPDSPMRGALRSLAQDVDPVVRVPGARGRRAARRGGRGTTRRVLRRAG